MDLQSIQKAIAAARDTEKAVAQITPMLAPLVMEAYQLFGDNPNAAAAKLQHVRDRLAAYWQVAELAADDFEKIWPVLSVVITGIVKAFNIGGRWGDAINVLNLIAAV